MGSKASCRACSGPDPRGSQVRPAASSCSTARASARRMSGATRGSSSWSVSTPTTSVFGVATGAAPEMATNTAAVVATSQPSTPTWSRVGESGCTPSTGTRPWLGFRPTTPQYAAGRRIEPPVSVPRAAGQTPAATSAAEPPLEPLAVRVGSTGLRASGRSGCGAPAAYSSREDSAKTSAPAARSRVTTRASRAAAGPAIATGLPLPRGDPATSIMSFTATATPCSGPLAARAGAGSARTTACSGRPSRSSRS